MTPNLDFGYPWWLSYGHLTVLAGALAMLLTGRLRRWSRWPMALLTAVALWAGVSAVIVRGFNAGGKAALPTENFLRSGEGRVIDIGAGTGRSSIMVLEARPRATLVALDLFGGSFDAHFGTGQRPQDRLLANLKAAGVDRRVSIETADMRKLPFEAASFDAAVSAYAMDHLPRDGSSQALAETARVVKPGGEFLLILVNNDRTMKFAFGPLLTHGGFRGEAWWAGRLKEAGFEILESGARPGTLYFLSRRPAATTATGPSGARGRESGARPRPGPKRRWLRAAATAA